MNIRLVTGFITGVATVVLLWCFFYGTGNDNQIHELSKDNAVEHVVMHKVVKEVAVQAKKEVPVLEKIAEDSPAPSPAPGIEIPETEVKPPLVKDTSEIKLATREPSPEVEEPLPEPRVSPPEELSPPESKELPLETSGVDKEKFFFWKPFSLKSKAEGFAKHITSASGVNCLVEKTGIAKYKVYYLHEDETDRLAKAARIKDTGIDF
jgi:hypothetical protein